MSHHHGSSTPVVEHVASWKLIATLTGYGAIAGLLIVAAFVWANPRIDKHKAEVLNGAILEVLGDAKTVKPLFLYKGSYTDTVPASADTAKLDRIYGGWNDNGKLVGYAIVGAEPGFGDVITLIFGYDPVTRDLIGMKVLDNKETPGLGDKIVKDTMFGRGFDKRATPLQGVKRGAGKGAKNEVDMITGATISSRAVIGIINRRLEKVQPNLPQAKP